MNRNWLLGLVVIAFLGAGCLRQVDSPVEPEPEPIPVPIHLAIFWATLDFRGFLESGFELPRGVGFAVFAPGASIDGAGSCSPFSVPSPQALRTGQVLWGYRSGQCEPFDVRDWTGWQWSSAALVCEKNGRCLPFIFPPTFPDGPFPTLANLVTDTTGFKQEQHVTIVMPPLREWGTTSLSIWTDRGLPWVTAGQ